MGTTCTAAVFGPAHVAFAQIGDSRAYLMRGGHLRLLTRDQTVAAQLVDAGALLPEQVAQFPYRHVLVQALGTKGDVHPVITDLLLEEGDRVLLCSDGLHGPVDDDAIAGHPQGVARCGRRDARARVRGPRRGRPRQRHGRRRRLRSARAARARARVKALAVLALAPTLAPRARSGLSDGARGPRRLSGSCTGPRGA